MKTLLTIIATATLSILAINSNAQSAFTNDADIWMGSENVKPAAFAVAELKMKVADNGFAAEWEAYNQNNITRYEIQLSEDNKNFSTVKRVNSLSFTDGKYQVDLNNTVILANKVYYRIKIVNTVGQIAFTESSSLRIGK